MENENKTEEKKDAVDLIAAANEAAAKLKAENDRREALLAKEALGGRSEAGVPEQKPDPDREAIERINKWLQPTGLKI